MLPKQPEIPAARTDEFAEIDPREIREAIEYAQREGFTETEGALHDLLLVVDDVLRVGGIVQYQTTANADLRDTPLSASSY
mgnify:CR=1 FL=1